MTDEEMRRLKRSELLDLLVTQGRENEALNHQVLELQEELSSRRIQLEEAGSIAEASLRLNGVFEAAQAAAAQYLDTLRIKSEETESICSKRIAEAEARAKSLEDETLRRCREMEANTEAKCVAMVARAETETKEFWDMVSSRLERFYAEHAGLRELLAMDKLNASENTDV